MDERTLCEEQESAEIENEQDEGVDVQCDKDLFQIQASPDHLFSNDNFHVYPLVLVIIP